MWMIFVHHFEFEFFFSPIDIGIFAQFDEELQVDVHSLVASLSPF